MEGFQCLVESVSFYTTYGIGTLRHHSREHIKFAIVLDNHVLHWVGSVSSSIALYQGCHTALLLLVVHLDVLLPGSIIVDNPVTEYVSACWANTELRLPVLQSMLQVTCPALVASHFRVLPKRPPRRPHNPSMAASTSTCPAAALLHAAPTPPSRAAAARSACQLWLLH